jgi:hemoglobin/transferrin/lactoferrin receptor protein
MKTHAASMGRRGLLLLAVTGLALAQPPGEAGPPEGEGEDVSALRQEEERLLGWLRVRIGTATGQVQGLVDLPYQALGIPGREAAGARTLQDALRGLPGAVTQRTSYGQVSPFLRNLTGYHTVLLYDAFRVNNSVLRSGPNEYWGLVEPTALSSVEAVLGPASVLHGSDAIGGVVQAWPRRQDPTAEDFWERRLVGRFSTAENSLSARAEISGSLGGALGFSFGVTGASFGDLDAGGDLGRQDHTGYSGNAQDFHLVLRTSDRWKVRLLAARAVREGIGRVHRTIHGVSWHGTSVGTDLRHNLDFEREFAGVVVEGRGLDGFAEEITVRAGRQDLEEVLDRVRSDGRRERSGFQVVGHELGVRLVSPTPLGRWTYGLDLDTDSVDSWRRNFNASGTFTGAALQGPVGDEAGYDLLGLYVQDEVALAPRLSAILGTRLTHARLRADEVQDPVTGSGIRLRDDWWSLVGNARLLYEASSALHLYAGAAQGFRAPNLSDTTRFDIARSNELEVPAPGLEPERFLSLEVGAHLGTEDLGFTLGLYHLIIDDIIIRTPTGAMGPGGEVIVTKRNSGDGHVQGIEFRGEWAVARDWRLRGSLAWTDGQIDAFPTSAPVSQREVITRLAPIQATLALRYEILEGLSIEPSVLVVAGQDRLSSSDRRDTQRIPPGGSPGYTIWSVDLAYELDERSRLFLSVENLTDKNYRIHGSGVQEPGLNLVVGLDLTF